MSDTFLEFVKVVGLAVTLCLFALYGAVREPPFWVAGPLHRWIVQRLNVDIANLQSELREERRQHREDVEAERSLNLRLIGAGETLTRVTEQVVTASPAPSSSPRAPRPVRRAGVANEIDRIGKKGGE